MSFDADGLFPEGVLYFFIKMVFDYNLLNKMNFLLDFISSPCNEAIVFHIFA
jgi:hypothetical protein